MAYFILYFLERICIDDRFWILNSHNQEDFYYVIQKYWKFYKWETYISNTKYILAFLHITFHKDKHRHDLYKTRFTYRVNENCHSQIIMPPWVQSYPFPRQLRHLCTLQFHDKPPNNTPALQQRKKNGNCISRKVKHKAFGFRILAIHKPLKHKNNISRKWNNSISQKEVQKFLLFRNPNAPNRKTQTLIRWRKKKEKKNPIERWKRGLWLTCYHHK